MGRQLQVTGEFYLLVSISLILLLYFHSLFLILRPFIVHTVVSKTPDWGPFEN